MTSRRDNNLGLNHVRVHARLSIVVQSNQSPVGDDTSNTTVLDDEILSSEGVEQLDVGAHEELREDGGGEEGGVLDDDVVLVAIVEWDANFGKEVLSGLTDNHGREELTAQPGASTGGDALLNDGDLNIRVLAQLPRAAQSLDWM